MGNKRKSGDAHTETRRYQVKCTLLTIVLCVTFFCTFATNGFSADFVGTSYNEHFEHYNDTDQYAYLADALLKGQLSLDLPVPDELAQMENPYDFEARKAIAQGGENPLYWDHAFYEGKYYCYFGVVPALMLYVPFQLLTGHWLSTSAAVCILGLAFVVCGCLLVFRIARAFYRAQPPFFVVALAACIFIGGSNIVYLGFVSRFYSVPIIASMVFTSLGLWFWLGAKLSAARNGGGIPCWRLAVGSVCMALNIGCRPQFILACLLAFPLFWDEIVRKRILFSRKSVKPTLAALLPFLLILLQGGYNMARFGSPLDFGSQYNLTGFDMTAYTQKPMTTLVVLFWYLLQPLHIEAWFPFIFRTSYLWPVDIAASNPIAAVALMLPVLALVIFVVWMWVKAVKREMHRPWKSRPAILVGGLLLVVIAFVFVNYLLEVKSLGGGSQAFIQAVGIATVEPMFGGYFWLCPMGLLVFTLPQVKSILKAHGVYHICVMALVLGAFVLVFDARAVGANQRYFSDFAWYVMLVSVLCLFAWTRRKRFARRAITLTTTAVVISILIGLGSLFSQERYDSIAGLNPDLYESVSSIFPEKPESVDEGSSNTAIDALLKPDKQT